MVYFNIGEINTWKNGKVDLKWVWWKINICYQNPYTFTKSIDIGMKTRSNSYIASVLKENGKPLPPILKCEYVVL